MNRSRHPSVGSSWPLPASTSRPPASSSLLLQQPAGPPAPCPPPGPPLQQRHTAKEVGGARRWSLRASSFRITFRVRPAEQAGVCRAACVRCRTVRAASAAAWAYSAVFSRAAWPEAGEEGTAGPARCQQQAEETTVPVCGRLQNVLSSRHGPTPTTSHMQAPLRMHLRLWRWLAPGQQPGRQSP